MLSIACCAPITCLAYSFSWWTAALGVAVEKVCVTPYQICPHSFACKNVKCVICLIRDPSFNCPLSVSHWRWDRKVHKWQMAEDSCWGPFKDDKTRWSGLDFPLQSAAEGRLPKEIWLQQFQQEPASQGIQSVSNLTLNLINQLLLRGYCILEVCECQIIVL